MYYNKSKERVLLSADDVEGSVPLLLESEFGAPDRVVFVVEVHEEVLVRVLEAHGTHPLRLPLRVHGHHLLVLALLVVHQRAPELHLTRHLPVLY